MLLKEQKRKKRHSNSFESNYIWPCSEIFVCFCFVVWIIICSIFLFTSIFSSFQGILQGPKFLVGLTFLLVFGCLLVVKFVREVFPQASRVIVMPTDARSRPGTWVSTVPIGTRLLQIQKETNSSHVSLLAHSSATSLVLPPARTWMVVAIGLVLAEWIYKRSLSELSSQF